MGRLARALVCFGAAKALCEFPGGFWAMLFLAPILFFLSEGFYEAWVMRWRQQEIEKFARLAPPLDAEAHDAALRALERDGK